MHGRASRPLSLAGGHRSRGDNLSTRQFRAAQCRASAGSRAGTAVWRPAIQRVRVQRYSVKLPLPLHRVPSCPAKFNAVLSSMHVDISNLPSINCAPQVLRCCDPHLCCSLRLQPRLCGGPRRHPGDIPDPDASFPARRELHFCAGLRPAGHILRLTSAELSARPILHVPMFAL